MIRGNYSYTVQFAVQAASELTLSMLELDYSEDGLSFSTVAILPPGATSYAWQTPARDVPNAELRLVAVDSRNHRSAMASNAFEVRNRAPLFAVAGNARVATYARTTTFTGTCENGYPVVIDKWLPPLPGSGSATVPCNSGNWTYSPVVTADSSNSLYFSQTDPVGHITQMPVTWISDQTPPSIVSGSFTLSAGAPTTRTLYVPTALEATDLSYITDFCFKSNSSIQPGPSDPCWKKINKTVVGVDPSSHLLLQNYFYVVGFVLGSYQVYAWLRDEVGNTTALSAAGAGTLGTDHASIYYDPGRPPVLINVIATNTDSPADPVAPADSELQDAAGSDVIVKWNAAASNGVSTAPISIYYTLDNSTYLPVAMNLLNGANGTCTVTPGVHTGCYQWKLGAPTSAYFKLRVTVTDTNGMVTASTSPALNVSPPIRFLAGNTDPGTNASASAAVLFSDLSSAETADTASLVVTDSGTIFFRDQRRGILKIDPMDGILRPFLKATGGFSGDLGPASAATLVAPYKIALDYSNGLLVWDYNRIRRVDLGTNIITTIIGGGTDPTTDGIDAKSVQIQPGGQPRYVLFAALPDGRIYFQSIMGAQTVGQGFKARVYDPTTHLVSSINLSGTGSMGSPTFPVSTCVMADLGLGFDAGTLKLNALTASGGSSLDANCGPVSGTATYTYWTNLVNFDPATGQASSLQTPNPGPGGWAVDLMKVTGRDGNLYMVNRGANRIYRFDAPTATYIPILGTGTRGVCADGQFAPLACNIDPQDVFASASGQLYFVDRGRIRAVDPSSNTVVTIAGQSRAFGDGGSPLSARLSNVPYIDQTNAGTIVLYDFDETRLREFTPGGTIATIAGNGTVAIPNSTSPALNQPLTNGAWALQRAFMTDPATGDVFFHRGAAISRLVRATGLWTDLVGGGPTAFYGPTADGLAGSAIMTPYPRVLGYNGSQLLIMNWQHFGPPGNIGQLKIYDTTTPVQVPYIGTTNQQSVSDICADGTLAAACDLPSFTNFDAITSYDSVGARWLILNMNGLGIRTVTSGAVSTVVTLNRPATSFIYRRLAGTTPAEVVHYCGTNGRLYRRDLSQTTDVALSWPASSVACAGRSLLYNATRNSLVFPYTENGLSGVAEYLNP